MFFVFKEYVTYRIPPVKTLDITIRWDIERESIKWSCDRNIDRREIIVKIEEDCLAKQAGIEIWDIIEEICRKPISELQGRVRNWFVFINYKI